MERDIANFDAMEVANALVSVSLDKRQFSSKLRGKGSVWNLAVLKLLPHKSKLMTTNREEFLVFQAWNNNINYVQKNYELIRGKLTGGHSGFTQQEKQVRDRNACICELQTPTSDSENRIQCFYCERRLHFLCANVHPETSNENFLCDFCGANLVEPEFLTIDPTWNVDEEAEVIEGNVFSSLTIDHSAEAVSQPNQTAPVPNVDTNLTTGQHGLKIVSSDSEGKGHSLDDASKRNELDMDCDDADGEDDIPEGGTESSQLEMDCDDAKGEDEIAKGVTPSSLLDMDCEDVGGEDDILEEVAKSTEFDTDCGDAEGEGDIPDDVTETTKLHMDFNDGECENKTPKVATKPNQPNTDLHSTEKSKENENEINQDCNPEPENDTTEHDTSAIPTSFTFWLPSAQYSSVNCKKDGTVGNRRSDFVAPRGWTNIVARHFNKINPFCTLSFLGHVFEPSNANATFFKGYAFCKNKPNCTANWSFKIEEFQETPVDCEVKVALTSGSIKHLKGDTCRRQLAFKEREETAIRLKHQTAFLENKTRFANADSKLLAAGNLTEVPKVSVLRNLVFELFHLNTKDDTTNAIECYQGIAKLKVYRDAKRRKVSRFARRQAVVVKGLIKEMETNLGIKPPVKKVKLAEKAEVKEEIVDWSSSDDEDIIDEPDWNKFQNVKIKPSCSRKRARSPQSKDEVWGDKKSKRIKNTSPQQHFMECVPLVPWGGEYDGVRMKNTCAIDSIMNVFIGLLHVNATFKKFVWNQKSANEISKAAYEAITTCQEMNFNEGKKVWIKDVLQLNLTALLNKDNAYDLAGSLDERGIYEVRNWFSCAMFTLCMNSTCDNPASQNQKFSTLERQDWKEVNLFAMIFKTQEEWLSQFAYFRESRESCLFCHEQKHSILSEISDRPWIMYHLASTSTEYVTEDKLIRIQKVGDQNYKVFAYIVIEGESDPLNNTLPHFVCKFIVDDIIIRYDGMSKSQSPEIEASPSSGKLEYIILVPENS